MAIYYFGYGSNMSSVMMREWCPNHKLIGKAQLIDWKLAFTRLSQRWEAGVADIIESESDIVWGGLYNISESDLVALDKKESNGVNYQRVECEIVANSQMYRSFTYIVINKAVNAIPTSIDYRDTMLQGAHELSLPDEYIQKIANLPIK